MKKSLWKQKLQLHALTSAWVDQVDAVDGKPLRSDDSCRI